jgi:putative peptidoglycan lipid II flippase
MTSEEARSSATGALARAGVIVSGAFLVSRALGWLRVGVTTSIFGASPQLDAFYAAFRIPDLIFQLVAAGALGSALIPVVAGLLAKDEQARAWRVVSIVANLLLVALIVLSLVFAIAAPVIVPLITPGFGPAQMDLTIELTRIMLLSPIFLALGSVASALLNADGRFTAAALAPISYNLAIIGGAILLGPVIGVTGLAIGVVVGSVAHLLVQVPDIARRTTYRYERSLDTRDETARTVFGLMVPRAVGLGAVQITFIVNTSLASGLATGAITAYQVAFTVLQLPLGLIAQPLGVVLLPAMSRALATGDRREFGTMVDRSLRLLAYTMMLVTVLAMVLRQEVVTLLFGYGRYDEEALLLTAETLVVFLIGLPAHSLIAIMARAFYAGHDTVTPVVAALLAVAINVAVSVLTVGTLGLPGLALGIALGAWAEALLLLVLLARRVPTLGALRELGAWAVFFGCALAAGLATWLVMRGFDSAFGVVTGKIGLALETAGAATAGGLVYVLLSRILRLSELPRLVSIVGRATGRRTAG